MRWQVDPILEIQEWDSRTLLEKLTTREKPTKSNACRSRLYSLERNFTVDIDLFQSSRGKLLEQGGSNCNEISRVLMRRLAARAKVVVMLGKQDIVL